MEDPANPPEGRLLRVYPPDSAEDKTSVDVIAIHGLGTTTPRTWEFKTKTGVVVNWLSDPNMLPNIVPSAKIYTFSWNAKYYEDASVARIKDVADVMLSNVQRQRDQENTHARPLIFVASCFGGLIVTKALEIANTHNSQYRSLLVATCGVVFLGSPLQGTRAGKAAQWQAMLGGILNTQPSQTLLEDLDGNTRALRETSENFVKLVTTPPMQTMTMCFWESQKTQVLKAVLPTWTLQAFRNLQIILVEEDSACLFGRPKQLLDAPHSMMNKFFGPNDANFGLVSNSIKKMVEQARRIATSQREASHLHNEHFMVSRRLNPLFTGREEELEKLKQALCPSLSISAHIAAPKVYVIHGMGGAGKSEVALKFAHDSRLEFWGIFWIDGRSETSITTGFATIARTCGHHDESREDVMLWLQNTTHSWLLILDNADNKDMDMAQFLPAGRNGRILITTRLIECAKLQTVGKDHYERLDEETVVNLLLKACEIELGSRSDHEDDARAVAELLGCHALAVIQAGAAISQGLCGLEEYKDFFSTQRDVLLKCSPRQAKSEYGGVYATFEVSATYLKDRNDQEAKDALQLLNFYAFMHFSDFPEIAFEEAWKNSRNEAIVSSRLLPDGEEDIHSLAPWHVSHLPPFMQSNAHDTNLNKLRLRNARSLLVSLSLLTFDADRRMTRMHPVSHFWSRDRLQQPEEHMNARLSGLSMLSLSIKDPYPRDVLPLLGQLQSHIESFADSLKEWEYPKHDFHFQQSLNRLSYVMYWLSCDSALFELLQMIPIQNDEAWLRTENGQKIQRLHGIGARDYGDGNIAVNLLEKLSEARLQTLPAEDPQCLEMQHSLALAYLNIGETAKAICLLEEVTKITTKTLVPEHPYRLASQHALARAYQEVEETVKAIELLEEVVKRRTKTLRSDNSDRLTSQHELARSYLKIEETVKAIELLEEVVKIRTKTLRLEHPDRLAPQHELARSYLEIGETVKAIELLEEVVKIRTKTLRPEHSNRLGSQHELARSYLEIGETVKAICLLEEVVKIQTKTLRPEHPDRLISQHELARSYLEIGETVKAMCLLEEVVKIETKTLRPEHPDRLLSQHVLARSYMEIGETAKAIELLEGVVKIRTKTLRPEHPDRLGSQHVLARSYLEIRETAKAIALLESVVEIQAKTLKADHPERVASIYFLAQCHYRARNYERALELARSIESVAQNRGKQKSADWNAELISFIHKDMGLEEKT